MGECGCSGWDLRLSFPGPGKTFYVLVVSRGCVNCDAPPAMCIERYDPSSNIYAEVKRGDFDDGELKFCDWGFCSGAAVVTGMRKHEFVQALKQHLVGVGKEMMEDGQIDETAAEVILEEMYEDSILSPTPVVETHSG